MELRDRVQVIKSLGEFGCIIDTALTNLIHIRNGRPHDGESLDSASRMFGTISDDLSRTPELLGSSTPIAYAFLESVELTHADWVTASYPFLRFPLSKGCLRVSVNLRTVAHHRHLADAFFIDSLIDSLAILTESSLLLSRIAARAPVQEPFISSVMLM